MEYLAPGFAVFNSHLNNARDRADAEYIRMFGQESFDHWIKPFHDEGIMSIFGDTSEHHYPMAWVVICTVFANEGGKRRSNIMHQKRNRGKGGNRG